MKIEMMLDAVTLAKVKQLKATRTNVTDQELVEQIFQRGLYDLSYRTKRNKQQWQERKEFQQWRKEREQNS